MKTQNSQNDKLDSLSTELFRSTALNDADIDLIISRDELFSSVRGRIIADNVSRIQSTNTITFFQRSAILTAAAAVIVVAVFGTMMIAKRPNQRINFASSVPPVRSYDDAVVRPIDLPMPPPKTETLDGRQAAAHIVKAMDYRPIVQERRPYNPPPQQQQLEEQPPQFFALAGLRPSEVSVDGSRIIRVELPRASLVTLGVNVPLDSDKQLIKTDLLVGPDGVPRAIRLVE